MFAVLRKVLASMSLLTFDRFCLIFHMGIDPRSVVSIVCRRFSFGKVGFAFYACVGESSAEPSVGNLALFKGQRAFFDLAHASHEVRSSDILHTQYRRGDMSALMCSLDPKAVNVHREPRDRYSTGDGVTRSLGVELTTKIMSQVLRAVFEFDGLRRGPGLSGTLKRYKVAEVNTLRHEYLGADYLPTGWPNTMILQV
ncbi:hypothetical protein F5148DRAFT_701742, partial [Russula earlei]